MSEGCTDDDDAVEADSTLAGDGETLHNSLSLSRSMIQDTIFMKSRYKLWKRRTVAW
jgi:hypothetical protein